MSEYAASPVNVRVDLKAAAAAASQSATLGLPTGIVGGQVDQVERVLDEPQAESSRDDRPPVLRPRPPLDREAGVDPEAELASGAGAADCARRARDPAAARARLPVSLVVGVGRPDRGSAAPGGSQRATASATSR